MQEELGVHVEKRDQTFYIVFFFVENLSPTFFVVPRAAVGDFGCLAHGSDYSSLTTTLEVKLSSRTLVDIMEAKILQICSSYFVPQFFFLDGFLWQLGFEQKYPI